MMIYADYEPGPESYVHFLYIGGFVSRSIILKSWEIIIIREWNDQILWLYIVRVCRLCYVPIIWTNWNDNTWWVYWVAELRFQLFRGQFLIKVFFFLLPTLKCSQRRNSPHIIYVFTGRGINKLLCSANWYHRCQPQDITRNVWWTQFGDLVCLLKTKWHTFWGSDSYMDNSQFLFPRYLNRLNWSCAASSSDEFTVLIGQFLVIYQK